MNQLFALVLMIASAIPISRISEDTSEVLIDPEFKGKIAVLDKPNGKVIASVGQDFENEDYLEFRVSDQTSDYFYGTLEYSISGKQVKGWTKKTSI